MHTLAAVSGRAPFLHARECSRLRRGVVSTAVEEQASSYQASRPLPGALWLLSFVQDRYYDLHGSNFRICRTESEPPAALNAASPRLRSGRRLQTHNAAATCTMVHRPQARATCGSTVMQLEGAVLDAELCEGHYESWAVAWAGPSNSVDCTGIVALPSMQQEFNPDDVVEDIFVTDSASPRRTKMAAFTCQICGARNRSRVNPKSFLQGTLVCQCKKCSRWHKLTDHLNLFTWGAHQRGDVLPTAPRLSMSDLPQSLRSLDPGFWWRPPNISSANGGDAADPDLN